jgi:hypothetical protein
MRNVLAHWKSIAMAILLVILNLVVLAGIGLAYAPMDWTRFATNYGYALYKYLFPLILK